MASSTRDAAGYTTREVIKILWINSVTCKKNSCVIMKFMVWDKNHTYCNLITN